jgi:hypothetical protein
MRQQAVLCLHRRQRIENTRDGQRVQRCERCGCTVATLAASHSKPQDHHNQPGYPQ